MSEYKNGKVYKIIHNQSDIVYIGSTFNRLNDRFYCHKQDHGMGKTLSICKYFTEYGIENFKIILIKEYKVIDKKHLLMYEQLWMNKIKNINLNKSFQPLFKERNKKYYKERNKEYYKEHREKNKDIIKEYNKEYYEINKEQRKEKLKEKTICKVCNLEIRKDSLLRHEKTKKHQKHLANNLSEILN